MSLKNPISLPARPSAAEVRMMVLADHCELRGRLDRLTRLLDEEHVESHGDTVAAARAEFSGLARFFTAHLEFEDAYLAPLMVQVCAWGEVRASALLAHHRAQREELADLLEMVESPGTDRLELCHALEGFSAALEADMIEEENAILTSEVLGLSPGVPEPA